MALQVISANRLRDGDVVFLAPDGAWVEDIGASRVARSEAEADALTAAGEEAVRAREVVDPYLFEVTEDGGRIWPVRYREVLRALGPSVRRDVGKQAVKTSAAA